ncbi:hypothetical protein COLO4_02617, partial [Corchorus olitorius]
GHALPAGEWPVAGTRKRRHGAHGPAHPCAPAGVSTARRPALCAAHRDQQRHAAVRHGLAQHGADGLAVQRGVGLGGAPGREPGADLADRRRSPGPSHAQPDGHDAAGVRGSDPQRQCARLCPAVAARALGAACGYLGERGRLPAACRLCLAGTRDLDARNDLAPHRPHAGAADLGAAAGLAQHSHGALHAMGLARSQRPLDGQHAERSGGLEEPAPPGPQHRQPAGADSLHAACGHGHPRGCSVHGAGVLRHRSRHVLATGIAAAVHPHHHCRGRQPGREIPELHGQAGATGGFTGPFRARARRP